MTENDSFLLKCFLKHYCMREVGLLLTWHFTHNFWGIGSCGSMHEPGFSAAIAMATDYLTRSTCWLFVCTYKTGSLSSVCISGTILGFLVCVCALWSHLL